MKAKLSPLLVALAVGAFAAAGCGSSNSSSSSDTSAAAPPSSASTQSTDTGSTSSGGGGGEQLALSADPSGALKFDKSTLQAKAGKVTIVMDNPSSVPHAVAVEGQGVDKNGQTVTQGQKSTVSVDLKAGSYTFYCPVDGHKAAGMQGKLTVK